MFIGSNKANKKRPYQVECRMVTLKRGVGLRQKQSQNTFLGRRALPESVFARVSGVQYTQGKLTPQNTSSPAADVNCLYRKQI